MIILLDRKENQIGRLSIKDISMATQTEELNGLTKFYFTIYLDAIDKMKSVEYVAHRELRDRHNVAVYKIINSKPTAQGYDYECIHVAHDELLSYGYVRESRMTETTAADALGEALKGSRWKVGKADETELKPCYFYDNSRIECISKILDTWDVELQYRITTAGNKIIGRYVDIVRQRGEDTGRRYVYGSNALEVVKEESQAGLYTAVIPRGKGEEKEDTGGFGRRINIKEVTWSKAKGNPLDKPKDQEYLEIPEMTDKFGYPDGSARFKVVVYSDVEKPEDLIQKAYADLVANSRPLVEFKSQIRETDPLNLGDTVGIIRRDLNIFYKTRVFKVTRDIKAGVTTAVELGDNITKTQADFNKSIKKNITESMEDTRNELGNSIAEAVKELQAMITDTMFDDNANWYFLELGNKWGYPPGFYTLNKPIDQNPTKGVYIGGGKMGISNSTDINGKLKWTTWATGDGIVADAITTGNLNASLLKSGTIDANLIRAGMLKGGNVNWNLNTGEFNIGSDLTYKNGVLDLNGALIVKEINAQSNRIDGSNLTLNGNTKVMGDFSVSGSSLFGTINASNINVTNLNADNLSRGTVERPYNYGKMENDYYDYELRGNAVAFNGNSGYITIKDTGGRGQVDINGTVAARGPGYVYELNSGGLHGGYGTSMIGQSEYATQLKGPGMESPSITIDSSGVVRIGRLFVNGKEITG